MNRIAEFQNLLARPNDLVKKKASRVDLTKKNKERPSLAVYDHPGRGSSGESSN